ncbi:CHAD domain-containing protein [Ferruginibacter profundus]
MKRKQVENIIYTHFKKLQVHFNSFALTCNAESIHLFRVEYKKLRAFLRLLAIQKKGSGKIKVSKKLKEIYHITGSIRDLQLQQQRITAFTEKIVKKPLHCIAILQKKIDELQKTLLQFSIKKIIARSKKKIGLFIPDRLSKSEFLIFFATQQETATRFVSGKNLTANNLHTIRKYLKDLLYNYKIYKQNKGSRSITVCNKKDDHYLSALLLHLGNFQEITTAITLLKLWSPPLSDKNNRRLLQQVKAKWLSEKRLIKKLLVTELDQCFSIKEAG